MNRKLLWFAPPVVSWLLSILTIGLAFNILRQVLKQKRFRFLVKELIWMVIFEISTFIYAFKFLNPDFLTGSLFQMILMTIVWATMRISLTLMFWNLAFMYYLSSKQLSSWVNSVKDDQNPDILAQKFTLKTLKYHKFDLIIKITICIVQIARSGLQSFSYKRYLTDKPQNNIAQIFCSCFNLVADMIDIAIIVLLISSINTFRKLAANFKSQERSLLYLQTAVCIGYFVSIVINVYVDIWAYYKHSIYAWEVWSIVTSTQIFLQTVCLWILIYTFRKFVNQPFRENDTITSNQNLPTADQSTEYQVSIQDEDQTDQEFNLALIEGLQKRDTIKVVDQDIQMPEDYDDSDLNEEDRFFQRTVMQNLISGGGLKPMRLQKSPCNKFHEDINF